MHSIVLRSNIDKSMQAHQGHISNNALSHTLTSCVLAPRTIERAHTMSNMIAVCVYMYTYTYMFRKVLGALSGVARMAP